MPLTPIQVDVFALIAANRSSDSLVAGGIPIARSSARKSHDIDLFHRSSAKMVQACEIDLSTLRAGGFAIELDAQFETKPHPSIRRAIVTRGAERLLLGWVVDSDFRFLPAFPDSEFGWVFNPIDIGVNKVLAATNHSEIRNIVDLVEISNTYLRLGALVAAAPGIDSVWSPESLLGEMSRHARRDPADYTSLPGLNRAQAIAKVQAYRALLGMARTYVAVLPTDALGVIYLENGRPVEADPARLSTYTVHKPVQRGHWPASAETRNEMLAERHGIAWDRPSASASAPSHQEPKP